MGGIYSALMSSIQTFFPTTLWDLAQRRLTMRGSEADRSAWRRATCARLETSAVHLSEAVGAAAAWLREVVGQSAARRHAALLAGTCLPSQRWAKRQLRRRRQWDRRPGASTAVRGAERLFTGTGYESLPG